MYMNGIKVFAKRGQRTGDPDANNNNNIQPGYRNEIGIENYMNCRNLKITINTN